jgi:type II secretory pathway pseudopilin PulG
LKTAKTEKQTVTDPQTEEPNTQQQAYRMRTQKNTSIKKIKKLPIDPKTNRDLKLGYQSKQPKISTKTSRYSIFTQNRTKTNDFVNRKMRTTTSSACSAACF